LCACPGGTWVFSFSEVEGELKAGCVCPCPVEVDGSLTGGSVVVGWLTGGSVTGVGAVERPCCLVLATELRIRDG
jgi:hypothetical protein